MHRRWYFLLAAALLGATLPSWAGDLNSDLSEAAKSGDPVKVLALLARGAEVDAHRLKPPGEPGGRSR